MKIEKLESPRLSVAKNVKLDGLAALSSVLVAVVVTFSIAHETAYFYVVGSRWVTLLSLSDFIGLALEWVPGVIVAIFFATLVLVAIYKLEAVSKKENSNEEQRRPKRKLSLIGSIIVFIALLLIIGSEILFGRGSLLALMSLFGAIVWLGAYPILFPIRIYRARMGSLAIMIIGMVPYLLLLSAAIGFKEGHNDNQNLAGHGMVAEITLKNGRRFDDVRVLRAFEKGVLIRRANYNELYLWPEIDSVSVFKAKPSSLRRSCIWFDLLCD